MEEILPAIEHLVCSGFFWPFLMVACFVLYFLPAVIAGKRDHRNELAILLLNLLTGWTILGWVGALVWSVYKDKPQLLVLEQRRRKHD